VRSTLIANPAAGDDSAPEHLDTIRRILRDAGDTLDTFLTEGPGHAESLAAAAAAGGTGRIYVAGGDGTLNQVLNGAGSVPGALERLTFGVLPLGTGNDFARELGLTDDLEQAMRVLEERRTLEVDVGTLNGRLFVNTSGGGFIAEVSEAVVPALKTIAGRLAYLVGGAQALWSYEPVRLTVSALAEPSHRLPDGAWHEGPPPGLAPAMPVHAFAVCNARQIGGGRLIAPYADITDGLLDLCLIEAMPTVEFVALLGRVAGGGHLDDARVTYMRARSAEIAFDRPAKVNTDGEVLETVTCRYEVRPRAARFFAAATRSEQPFPRSAVAGRA
jgi:diacylglycerol kinase (ATP)